MKNFLNYIKENKAITIVCVICIGMVLCCGSFGASFGINYAEKTNSLSPKTEAQSSMINVASDSISPNADVSENVSKETTIKSTTQTVALSGDCDSSNDTKSNVNVDKKSQGCEFVKNTEIVKNENIADNASFMNSNDENLSCCNSNNEVVLPNATYYFGVSSSPNQIVEVKGASTAQSTPLQLYTAVTPYESQQQWKIENLDDGYVKIVNVKSGMVMDVVGGQAVAGTRVQQYPWNSSVSQQNAQKWKPIKNSNGSYSFASALDNSLVLDCVNGKTDNETPLQIYTNNGTAAQKFYTYTKNPVVEPSSADIVEGYYAIQSRVNTGFYVDLEGGSDKDGANIHLWRGSVGDSNNRIYKIEKDSQGFYTITNAKTKKAVEAAGAGILPNTNIQQYTYNDSNAQKWSISMNASGSYTFKNKCNGLVFDIAGGTAADGQNIQCYVANGSKAQQWNLIRTNPVKVSTAVENVPMSSESATDTKIENKIESSTPVVTKDKTSTEEQVVKETKQQDGKKISDSKQQKTDEVSNNVLDIVK